MLLSLAIILLSGILFGRFFKQLKLPSLLGMLLAGILLGAFQLIDAKTMSIAAELRQIALVVILMRAGLALNLGELRRVGRGAILLCFVPACFEIMGMILLAPPLLHITTTEALVMGAVVGAVSPAVIVPRMLHLIREGYREVPQMIMAGSAVDDIFVIVIFGAATTLASSGTFSPTLLLKIPVQLILGIAVGIVIGFLLIGVFKRFHMCSTIKVLLLLCVSFFLIFAEQILPISGLLAVMTLGAVIFRENKEIAEEMSAKFSKLWIGAEIMLFVLVGATVNLQYALSAGIMALVLILGALLFRMLGVLVCLIGTKLDFRARIFCVISYMPKATVQAAIGAIPLSMGLSCGPIVLTVAVLSILITAPIGAICIDSLGETLLSDWK